jgi:hypothetical protein
MIANVSHISQYGIRLLLAEREMFLSYKDFPWFKDATVSAVLCTVTSTAASLLA